MLSLLEQAFVGRDEKRAPLKTPAWEARLLFDQKIRAPPPGPLPWIRHLYRIVYS